MPKWFKWTAGLLALVGVASVLLLHLWRSHQKSVESAVSREKARWQEKVVGLEDRISRLEEENTVLRGGVVPAEKLIEAFGKGSPPKEEPTLQEIELQVLAFFSYLDSQAYIKAYELEDGTYAQYQKSVEILSAGRPIISGEMDSITHMVRNAAHFYRALGRKRMSLVKDILKTESDLMASAMRTFHLWFTLQNGGEEKLKGRPSRETLYTYAAFFLNTQAGRNYLLRRDPRVRNLTLYYAVLLLDRANDEKLNSAGIDIRPHLKSVSAELENQVGLFYQKQYLATLESLQRKYAL